MKNCRFKISLCIAIIIIFNIILSGCGIFDDSSTLQGDRVYTIMYSDGTKTHTIEVKSGDVYSIATPLPSKTGYDFMGLYDAEIGGTQYVNSFGLSISAFYDNKNITLFPQFRAKEFTLLFNYGEATKTGVALQSVEYDKELAHFPANLVISEKLYMIFVGWFTEKNCNGIKVADSDGVPLLTNISQISELSNFNGEIDLYAGFEVETHTVTFYSADGSNVLRIEKLAHGTNIADINLQIKEGDKEVIAWSSSVNGKIFTESVTRDLSLFSLSYSKEIFNETIRKGSTKLAGSSAFTIDEIKLATNIEELLSQGFVNLEFTITFSIKENDQCYQYLYLYDSTGVLIYEDKTFSHSGSAKDTSYGSYTIVCAFSLAELKSNIIYFKCQAEPNIFKDFYLGTVTVKITAYSN